MKRRNFFKKVPLIGLVVPFISHVETEDTNPVPESTLRRCLIYLPREPYSCGTADIILFEPIYQVKGIMKYIGALRLKVQNVECPIGLPDKVRARGHYDNQTFYSSFVISQRKWKLREGRNILTSMEMVSYGKLSYYHIDSWFGYGII